MDGCAGRDGHDVDGFRAGVAANVGGRGVFDALFRVGILGLSGRGPIFLFRFAVHDESGEGI
jgi:hypothetical protein